MKKLYSQIISFSICTLVAVMLNVGIGYAFEEPSQKDSTKTKATKVSSKITDTRKNKPASINTGFKFEFKPFNIKEIGTTAPAVKIIKPEDDKVLNNVNVYPNPVQDQLNLSYRISKESNVTIKIMDVLGNEITTLFSQKASAGDQTNSFNVASRLKSGVYFVRLVVGQETIIKRISVL